jgi:hypothetical protein
VLFSPIGLVLGSFAPIHPIIKAPEVGVNLATAQLLLLLLVPAEKVFPGA